MMTHNRNISRPVSLLVLLFLGNFGTMNFRDSEGKPLNKKCDAPVATEGHTGVMTFFLRESIDLQSDGMFILLARARKPGEAKIIATCHRNSPLKCTSQYEPYQINDRIDDHKLTLQIPNVTTDFEGNYVLQVYVDDIAEPSDTCHLTVQKENSTRPCNAPTVKEGDTGVMTFFFHEDVVSNHLTAKLAKKHHGVREIISCHRKVAHSTFKCEIKDTLFIIDGSVHHSLKILIPRITRNLDGHYILEVMDNNSRLLHQSCYLKVNDVPADTKQRNEIPDHKEIFIVIAVALVIIAICLGILVFRQASCKQRNKEHVDGHNESAKPLFRLKSAEQKNAHETKRWFFRELSDEDENQFFLSKRNAPGSFLVRVSPTNPGNYILAVLLKCGIKYRTLIPEEGRLLCQSTGKSFDNLCEFVNYYRENDINVNNTVWGKLTKPFEQEPDAEWYFGKLADDQAKKILQKNGPGSFLVMVSYLDNDSYDLAVNYRDKVLFFGIVPEDDGFRMLDTHEMFESVDKIVDYFTHNELKIDEEHNYGILRKPCNKDSDD